MVEKPKWYRSRIGSGYASYPSIDCIWERKPNACYKKMRDATRDGKLLPDAGGMDYVLQLQLFRAFHGGSGDEPFSGHTHLYLLLIVLPE